MKIETHKTVEVVIIMSEDEAIWLKTVIQNPINCLDPEDESEIDKSMRAMFWAALNREGI
jgi:hypothetical protein